MLRASLLLCLLASPALAEEPMTAAEFEAYVTGRTLTYALGDEAFGVERYHPNRRVTWAFVDDDCVEGEWYPAEDGQICFVYPDLDADQCWRFYEDGARLRAEFVDGEDASPLYEVRDQEIPLICPGYGV